jgi:hypothetical protein
MVISCEMLGPVVNRSMVKGGYHGGAIMGGLSWRGYHGGGLNFLILNFGYLHFKLHLTAKSISLFGSKIRLFLLSSTELEPSAMHPDCSSARHSNGLIAAHKIKLKSGPLTRVCRPFLGGLCSILIFHTSIETVRSSF